MKPERIARIHRNGPHDNYLVTLYYHTGKVWRPSFRCERQTIRQALACAEKFNARVVDPHGYAAADYGQYWV